jgi:hypothetical protein
VLLPMELSGTGLGGVLRSYAGYGGLDRRWRDPVFRHVVPRAAVGNAPFRDLALKAPFFVAHLVYGLAFGLIVFALLRSVNPKGQGLT